MERLIEGFRRFCEEHYSDGSADVRQHYQQLSQQGQHAKILVIACSDSRVDPAILMRAEPGEIMVIRNVANLVPELDSLNASGEFAASLEFAVSYVGVRDVLLLGHSRCSGLQSLLLRADTDFEPSSAVDVWMNQAQEAAALALRDHPQDLDQQLCSCSRQSLRDSLARLHDYPFIAERIAKEQLALHAWYYCLSDCSLERWDAQAENFESLVRMDTA